MKQAAGITGLVALAALLGMGGARADEPGADAGVEAGPAAAEPAAGSASGSAPASASASVSGSTSAPAPTTDTVVPPVHVTAAHDRDSAAPHGARALDEPAFVTSIDIDADGARDAGDSAASVIARAPGVSLRSFGGLGAFASIVVRGAPAAETLVLVDGVPLSRLAFAGIDLGGFELGTFDRVDVYRGGVPVELGGAALGGAVNFVTEVGPRPGERPTRLVLAFGSFGARRLGITRRDRLGAWGSTIALGYAGATGDYRYYDDGGTPLNPGDDGERVRTNNGYDQVDLGARQKWRGRGTTVELGQRLSWKAQGIPGPAGAMATEASLSTWRALVDGRVRRGGALGAPRLTLGAGAHALVEAQRFLDPKGEIGLSMQDSRYLTLAAGGTLSASWRTPRHIVGASLEPGVEWFREDDAIPSGAGAPPSGLRLGGGLSLADTIDLDDDLALVVPALRVDVLASRPSGGMGEQTKGMAAPRNDVAFSPRVAARVTIAPGLAVKSSVGRYFRAPTVIELYGDRGFLVGNPTLAPETGTTADLGLVLAPAGALGAVDRGYLEVAGFAGWSSSLIAWVPTSGHTSVAKNLGDARLRGVEVAAQLRAYRTLTLSGNYTLLDTVQDSPLVPYDGKALPGRPRHELYLRADADGHARGLELAARADVSLLSGNYLDQGNLNLVPARRLVGAGVRVGRGTLSLSLDVRNLLDERVADVPLDPPPRPDLTSTPRPIADVLGYPLPGRSLLVTVSWAP